VKLPSATPVLVLICTLLVGAVEAGYPDGVASVLEAHCFDCHGDGESKGEVDLEWENLDLSDEDFWTGVKSHLHAGTMPPEKKPQPSAVERKELLGWIDDAVFGWSDPQALPGRALARRLTRFEYACSVRDLFGREFAASDRLPPDDSGYGFDNIADILSISPALLEHYLSVAEEISLELIPEAKGEVAIERVLPREFRRMHGTVYDHHPGYQMLDPGELRLEVAVGVLGAYKFRFEVAGERFDEVRPEISVAVGGEILGTQKVESLQPKRETREFDVVIDSAGPTAVALAYLNDAEAPQGGEGERALWFYGLEIVSPVVHRAPSAFARQWFDLSGEQSVKAERSAVGKFVREFGRVCFRRSLAEAEQSRLRDLYWAERDAGGSVGEAARVLVQAFLVSPRFLFRGIGLLESSAADGVTEGAVELELASRLSYLLWSSTPDTGLLDLAEAGELGQGLNRQVERMLSDWRGYALSSNFVAQWLGLRDLDLASPDPERYPGFDRELALSMRRETEMFLADMIRRNLPLGNLLDADFTFLNERLAGHYGIELPEGRGFRRVSLEGSFRRGVLGHGSVLTLTSNPTRTSPVKRGKFVLENLLGLEVPPAPQDVPAFDEDRAAGVHGGVRERLQAHRSDPACAACHRTMDAYGFALEHFGATGQWRDQDDGFPIDSTGAIDGVGEFANHLELIGKLGEDSEELLARSFVSKLFIYALGRGLEKTDRPAIRQVLDKYRADGYPVRDLLRGVVESVPFRRVGE